MAESFALVDGVYVPTGKFTPVRSDRQGVESIISGTSFSTIIHQFKISMPSMCWAKWLILPTLNSRM